MLAALFYSLCEDILLQEEPFGVSGSADGEENAYRDNASLGGAGCNCVIC